MLVYFSLKWATYSFLGWVFLDKKHNAIISESYTTLIFFMGFVLYPIVLLIVFFHFSATSVAFIGFYIVVFAKILIFYKWIKLFSLKLFRHLLLILYFCALEIIPCYLFYQSMIQMNNKLIINF
jgi:hypothetical protein